MQASSTQKTKDSAGRRLGNLIKKGVKKLGGHEVFPGDILVRQRGFRWHNGKNTTTGKDHTIHSLVEGVVQFQRHPNRQKTFIVHVDQKEIPNRLQRPPPPYCYHPELFPERALFNPQPTNLVINKNQQNKTSQNGTKCQEKQQIVIPQQVLNQFEKKTFKPYQEQIENLYKYYDQVKLNSQQQ